MTIAHLIEDLFSLSDIAPGGERRWLAEGCLSFSPGDVPTFSTVTAVRASRESLADLVATAGEWFAGHGRDSFTWFLGPSTTPPDAVERLLDLGATGFEHLDGMALDHEPPSGPRDVEVHEVRSPEELLEARLLLVPSGGGALDDATRDSIGATNGSAWAALIDATSRRRMFVARLDGTIRAAGGMVTLDDDVVVLAGGATDPSAQHRGLYRSLVHARWAAAVETGRSALIATATPRSAPILSAAGFATLVEITVLRHETATAAGHRGTSSLTPRSTPR